MLKKLIEWFERQKKISAVMLIACIGIMFYFSSLPGGAVGYCTIWPSRIYHFSIFAAFAFFLFATISEKTIKPKKLTIVFFLSLLMSILDEFHQVFVPLRHAGITDILTDTTGALAVILIYSLIKKFGK